METPDHHEYHDTDADPLVEERQRERDEGLDEVTASRTTPACTTTR